MITIKTSFGDYKHHQAASDLDMTFEILVFMRSIYFILYFFLLTLLDVECE